MTDISGVEDEMAKVSLEVAVRRNRKRQLRNLELQAKRFNDRAKFFEAEAVKIDRNAHVYLDATEEAAYQRACAAQFVRSAERVEAEIADLKATLKLTDYLDAQA